MIERIAFTVFRICLLSCASLVLLIIWMQDRIENPLIFQGAATLFVIGLAAFLLWFSSVLLGIRASARIDRA